MSYKPFTNEYTLQIIDDIKEYLEETNKYQTTLDTLDLCHLIGEIERLNKCYCERTDCAGRIKNSTKFDSVQEENERLNNIINELNTAYCKVITKCEELENQLQQKENIIKEVREYIRNKSMIVQLDNKKEFAIDLYLKEPEYKELLKILDKGSYKE